MVVFNLSNGVEVEETKSKVDRYKKENQTHIMRNRMRQVCFASLHACPDGGREPRPLFP